MLQKLRQHFTLALLAALPFHALLVTVGTNFIAGPGHAPLTILALWKEALLGVILVIALAEVISTIRRDAPWRVFTEVDVIDVLIVALILLSIGVTASTHGDFKLYLFGFKYDFIPLIAFLILRRVEWSTEFKYRLMFTLIILGVLLSLYGIATFFLPQSFFVLLGYSDLHSLYLADGPLAAFQQIGGTSLRRIQSTMSGPNQFGLWMLIPLGLLLMKGMKSKIEYGLFTLFAVAILLTFSRSAWIAAAVMTGVTVWRAIPRKTFFVLSSSFLVLFAIGVLIAPQVILRAASTRDHLVRPLRAVQTIIQNPLGLGLGIAGPASNRVSDTCVHLEEGADASWASDRPELCVFVGETQVQPEEECNCPNLPENWYLQIGVEIGLLGMALFILITVLVFLKLKKTGLIFLGVSIAALFLHAWEDAAVAYTVWVIVAMLL